MNNLVLLVLLCVLLAAAIVVGHRSAVPSSQSESPPATTAIPHIGSVQVLNGCGEAGAAKLVEDFLRSRSFDVKNRSNAPTANYPFTMVVSRNADMTTARQVAAALKTERVMLVRADESLYGVDVIVGPDYQERIR